jgi:endonuclease/exonuclease/phosphatase family metal-dependent hydrolase
LNSFRAASGQLSALQVAQAAHRIEQSLRQWEAPAIPYTLYPAGTGPEGEHGPVDNGAGAESPPNTPIVLLCGDFNTEPQSEACQVGAD